MSSQSMIARTHVLRESGRRHGVAASPLILPSNRLKEDLPATASSVSPRPDTFAELLLSRARCLRACPTHSYRATTKVKNAETRLSSGENAAPARRRGTIVRRVSRQRRPEPSLCEQSVMSQTWRRDAGEPGKHVHGTSHSMTPARPTSSYTEEWAAARKSGEKTVADGRNRGIIAEGGVMRVYMRAACGVDILRVLYEDGMTGAKGLDTRKPFICAYGRRARGIEN